MILPTPLSALELSLRTAVCEAWVNNEPTTALSLARATGAVRPSGHHPNSKIQRLLQLQVDTGIATLSIAETGAGFVCWNWTGRPVQRETLADVLGPYLDSADVPPSHRQLVKEGLRAVLAGDVGTSILHTRADAVLLAAAAHVPGTSLTGLATRALGLEHAKRREYARAIRGLLRWAFQRNLVVVHTREPLAASSWTRWIDTHVPAIRTGKELTASRKLRGGIQAWRLACERTNHPLPPTMDEMSPSQARAVLDAVETLTPRGRQTRDDLAATLRALGFRGLGPWRSLSGYRGMVKISDRHWSPWFVLNYRSPTHRKGNTVPCALQVREILEQHQMPACWQDFLQWYDEWATAELITLRAKWGATFQRNARRKLKQATLEHRYRALRTLLGTAHQVLGWNATDCTPADVFGTRFPEIVLALQQSLASLVRDRSKLLAEGVEPPGADLSTDSPMMTITLVHGGMLAEALAEWGEWAQRLGHPVATETQIESWRSTFRYAMDEVLTIPASSRKQRTRKDLSTILHDTPSFALLPGSLAHVGRLVEREPDDRCTALAVQRHIIAYFVASGTTRAGEPGQFRFDQHYAELRSVKYQGGVLRRFRLDAHERKGQLGSAIAHEYPLLEEYVPTWLWTWWCDTGRALLMRPWVAAGHEPHEHVFMAQNDGGPMVDSKASWVGRATAMVRSYFMAWRVEALQRQGIAVTPHTYGQHTPHAERARMEELMTAAGIPDEHQKIVLGHKGQSTLATHYRSHEAATVARLLRKVHDMLHSATAARSPLADGRLPTRRASAPDMDSALAKAVRRELFVELENLSPRDVYSRIQALQAEHGA